MSEWIASIGSRIKEKTGKDKKPLLIVALGVAGMLFLLLSGGTEKAEKKSAVPELNDAQATVTRQLEALLKTVDGVGKVKVCLTVERMQTSVYAVNTEQTSEQDRLEKSEKYVLAEAGNDTQGLLLYTVMPEIRGVAVSCEGGGSVVVRQEVTRLVSAALGLPSNRIWVAKMQS